MLRVNSLKVKYVLKRQKTIKWGLFSDIHFQDEGLERIEETAQWILETFKKKQVTHIICLGDVLNTREMVSVQALSSCMNFFNQLSKISSVSVILGNHDMNLKLSGRISSLDGLELNNNINLYKEMKEIKIENIPVCMIPYQFNQNNIKEWIKENKIKKEKYISFCHMSIPNSIYKYQKDNKRKYLKKFESDENLNYLSIFKRVFSGHFHHHHYVNHSNTICYVGSPMQHHFGDSGDDKRGCLIFNPIENEIEFIQNPNWDIFRILRINSNSDILNLKEMKNKKVSIIYENDEIEKDKIQNEILSLGATSVRKHSINYQIKSNTIEILPGNDFNELIKLYLNISKDFNNENEKEIYFNIGLNLFEKSNIFKKDNLNTFDGNIKSISIQNFLGIQNEIKFNFNEMNNGIWFITGNNGTGKSTILEAIIWCLFDKFLRSDMRVGFSVNDKIKKNCKVRIEFENDYVIERRRNFEKTNSLKIYYKNEYLDKFEKGNMRDSQKMLEEELIGINYETFIKSIICDNNIRFLISDSNSRRKMIEELLGLQKFDILLDVTKIELKNLNENKIKLKFKIESLQNELINLKNEKIDFEKDEKEELDEIFYKNEVVNLELKLNEIKNLKMEMEEKQIKMKQLSNLKLKLKLINEKNLNLKLKEIQNKINNFEIKRKEMYSKMENKLTNHQILKNEKIIILKEIINHNIKECLICNEEIKNINKLKDELLYLNKSLNDGKENEKEEIELNLFHFKKEFERIQIEIKNDLKEKEELNKLINELNIEEDINSNNRLHEIHSIEINLNSKLLNLKFKKERIELKNKRYNEILNRIKFNELNKIKNENELNKIKNEIKIYEFWLNSFQKKTNNSFPTLRSFLLEKSIIELNKLLNEYSDFLSYSKQKNISFDKELNIEQNDYGKRSSGQRKRNDLIILFSLFDLVKQRGKFKSNFLMLDEVFDALDLDGKNQIHEILNILSKKISKIFIISHSSEMIKGSKNIIKTTYNELNGTNYSF
eukprot:gene353-6767_t